MILTYRYRIKDASTARHLERHARAVNFVWNYCCDAQKHAQRAWKQGRANGRWPSAFDLIKLTTGTGKELRLHSDTIGGICRQFAVSRDKLKHVPRFRGHRSLGWIPVNAARGFQIKGDSVRYLGRRYRLWISRPLDGQIKTASFSQDARGRWYFNVVLDVETKPATGRGEVGVDLGLKDLAVLSDGTRIENPRWYREMEDNLATAQRSRNKQRVKAIHAKIENRRKHYLHEQSTRLVRNYRRIVVGNVNASALAKTNMAKSVLDASWSTFRNQLQYKALAYGAEYQEVSEVFSTQTCSSCGSIPDSSPKGMGALGIRHWICSNCGASHDRDRNAALNILVAAERRRLAEEIPVL